MYVFAFRSGQKSAIEDSIAELKKAMEGDNADAIKAAQEDMTQEASHKLAEAMYAKATSKGAGEAGAAGAGASEAGAQTESVQADNDVVDADFKEVNKDS